MILRFPQLAGVNDEKLFNHAVGFSILVHGFVAFAMFRVGMPAPTYRPPIEIDLTQPPGTGPRKLAAPKRKAKNPVVHPPNVPTVPVAEVETPDVVPVPVVTPTKPDDWVLPTEETKTVETLAVPVPVETPGGVEGGTGTADKEGGIGAGFNDGVPGGMGTGGGGIVKSNPILINLDDLLDNIQRFYPERDRRLGNESSVRVILHISAAGIVTDASVDRSGGRSFDEAALKVAPLMRFKPAIDDRDRPVAVKVLQTIGFELLD